MTAGPTPGYCLGCARPSRFQICADCQSHLDRAPEMVRMPHGDEFERELVARLERERATAR
jgi:predicted amidophosphoribosyltransferase